jgi:signal peptidase II
MVAEPVAWGRWFWPCLLIVLVLDQVTKTWLFGQPMHSPSGALNPGAINGFPGWIERSYNPGVAWGMLRNWPGGVTALTVILVPVMGIAWWRYFRTAGRIENIAFGSILGGAIGNGIDRFLACCGTLHGVRDFIMVDLHPIGIRYIWPTFNIADAGISVGFVLLAAIAVARPKPVQTDRHAHVLV